MTANYEITTARAGDYGELSRLINSAYRGETALAGWTTEAEYIEGQRIDPEMLTSELAQEGHTMLCLRERADKPIVGCVLLRSFEDVAGPGMYLGMLTVQPKMQDAGLGRVLMNESEKFARKAGAKRMNLRVIHFRESLIEWYERQGYKRTGDTSPFPYGNEREGLPLRDDLFFVIFEKPL